MCWNARCSERGRDDPRGTGCDRRVRRERAGAGDHAARDALGLVALIMRASVETIDREARTGSTAIDQLAVIFFFANRAGWRDLHFTGRRRG
jgi:hypothetical protein